MTTDSARRRFNAMALPHLDDAYGLARWLRRCGETAESRAVAALRRGVRRPAPGRPFIAPILYIFTKYNRAIWRNETNSSESPGFPGLSAEFSSTALIFRVNSKRRQAAQRRRRQVHPFSPCGRRWREAPDEGSARLGRPIAKRNEPLTQPSPARGEGVLRRLASPRIYPVNQ